MDDFLAVGHFVGNLVEKWCFGNFPGTTKMNVQKKAQRMPDSGRIEHVMYQYLFTTPEY